MCPCHAATVTCWPAILNLPSASPMTPTTTYRQNLPGSSFCIRVHSRGSMPSPPRALPQRSTPGHHRVGLEVSAAWQFSGWRAKCLFALLLAPQALSNSLGITVTWLGVGGTLSLLILTAGQGREWRSSPHGASISLLLQIPSFKELQFFHLPG